VNTKIGAKSAKSCASTTLEVQRYAPLPVQFLLGKCLQARFHTVPHTQAQAWRLQQLQPSRRRMRFR
jgi:hypothetical protein